jgi:GWxTD domain-containing protein
MLVLLALALLLAVPQQGYAQKVEDEGSEWIEQEEAQPQGIPARGRGDLEFSLDSVGFRDPEGSTVQEFFLEVGHSQLTFQEAEDGYEAVARLEIKVKNTETGAKAKDERVARIHAASLEEAARDDLAAVLISRFTLKPGLYTYEAKLTDLQARKWELVHLFKGTRKNGVAEGYFEVKDFSGGLRLADVLLARQIQPLVNPSPYSRGELGIIPNPSHTFGLFQPTLRAYVEVYAPSGEEERGYKVRYSILSSEGEEVATQTHDLRAVEDRWGQVAEFNLSEIPGGSYVFRAEVSSDVAIAVSETPMDILWDTVSWSKPDAELFQEMSFALSEDQLYEFKHMSKGEREIFMRSFWEEMDETPGTARNEVKEEFERRIAYANAHFGETEKGIFTDRGRIYVRYGEPDDRTVEVMPVGTSTLDWVIEDEVEAGSMDAEMMRKGGSGDERAYEIWYYNLRGHELFPSLIRTPKRQVGLKFIFVDENGYGNFVLRHRTDD